MKVCVARFPRSSLLDLSAGPQFFARAQIVELVVHHQADPGLSRDLELLAGDTTDDLDAL